MMSSGHAYIRKVALWLGHADIRTTEVYLGMDPSESSRPSRRCSRRRCDVVGSKRLTR